MCSSTVFTASRKPICSPRLSGTDNCSLLPGEAPDASPAVAWDMAPSQAQPRAREQFLQPHPGQDKSKSLILDP